MLSVIIPTFNRPNLLAGSLGSILSQTITDLEVIVVDGSNNDDTRKLISALNDQRIKYLKIKNVSASHSRNIGIRNVTGDFVAFNDDDDIWCSVKAEEQLKLFQHNPSEKVVYSAFSKLIGKTFRNTPDKTVLKKRGNIYDAILQQNFIGLPTIMLPLACCQEEMFDERLKCLEDWDWIIRLAKKFPFEFIEEPLVRAGNTPGSVNKSNYKTKTASYKTIYDKYYSDIHQVPAREAKHLLSIGSNLCLSGKMPEGRKYLSRALRLNPKDPKIFGAYLLSFMGTVTYRSGFTLFEQFTQRQP